MSKENQIQALPDGGLFAERPAEIGNVWVGSDIVASQSLIVPPNTEKEITLLVHSYNLPKVPLRDMRKLRIKESGKSRLVQVGIEPQDGIIEEIINAHILNGHTEVLDSIGIRAKVFNHAQRPVVLPANGVLRLYSINEEAYVRDEKGIRNILREHNVLFGGIENEDWEIVEDGSVFFRISPRRLWIPKDGGEPITIDPIAVNSLSFRSNHIDQYFHELPDELQEEEVFTIGETTGRIVLIEGVYGEIDETMYEKVGKIFLPAGRQFRSRLLVSNPRYNWEIRHETLSTARQARNHYSKIRFAKSA